MVNLFNTPYYGSFLFEKAYFSKPSVIRIIFISPRKVDEYARSNFQSKSNFQFNRPTQRQTNFFASKQADYSFYNSSYNTLLFKLAVLNFFNRQFNKSFS